MVAFALYPMERSALADDAYVGPYLVRVVSALQNLLDDGAREEAKYVKVVLLQRHTVLFVASILLMAAFLAVGATWRLWRLLIGKAFGLVCGAGGGGEYEDDGGDDLDASSDDFVASGAAEGSPSFDLAVTSGTLQGLESYTAESHPKYHRAFRKVAWMHVFQRGATTFAGQKMAAARALGDDEDDEDGEEDEYEYEDVEMDE